MDRLQRMSSTPSGARKKLEDGTERSGVTGGRSHADTADLPADPGTDSLAVFPTSNAEATAHRAVIQLARLLARQAAREVLTQSQPQPQPQEGDD